MVTVPQVRILHQFLLDDSISSAPFFINLSITGQSKLKGTSAGLSNFLLTASLAVSSNQVTHGFIQLSLGNILVSNIWDCIIFPSNLFQCLTVLIGKKKAFPYTQAEPLHFDFCLLSIILLLCHAVKSLASPCWPSIGARGAAVRSPPKAASAPGWTSSSPSEAKCSSSDHFGGPPLNSFQFVSVLPVWGWGQQN